MSRIITRRSGLYGTPAFYQVGNKRLLEEFDKLEADWEIFEQDDPQSDFLETFEYHPLFFKPRIFDAKVAYRCGLLPFSYDGEGLLSFTGGGMDLRPHLDAYQVLMIGSIDSNSTYFRDRSYFKCVIGKKVLKEIDEILKPAN